jgi:HK97 family phage major capsid protein
LFPEASNGELLGAPLLESEAMATYTTVDDYVLVYGGFRNYVIADRSSSVEFIPHLFSTGAGRPTGQRGFFAYFRTGADSVNDGGFRLLKV